MERKSTSTFFTRTLSSYVFKRITVAAATLTVSVLFVLAASSAPQPANSNVNAGQTQAAADWKPVEQALGKAGSMQPGDVYKVSLPRSDLKVTVGGVELRRKITSWTAPVKCGPPLRLWRSAPPAARSPVSGAGQIGRAHV